MATSTPRLGSRTISVAVVGVGLVGREFVGQLLALSGTGAGAGPASDQNQPPSAPPPPFRLISLSSSTRTLFCATGLAVTAQSWPTDLARSSERADLDELLTRLRDLARPSSPSRTRPIETGTRVVLVDNTASDVVAAWYAAFLRAGVSVVTPNKRGFSGALGGYEEMVGACAEANVEADAGGGGVGGVRVLNEASVGAGLPVVGVLRDLVGTGDKVRKIEGVFSGTMSFIFNEFSRVKGVGGTGVQRRFSEVVREAREKGFTEPHPGDDLNGADVARKLTILSRLIPGLQRALPDGYQSVSTESLVPRELEGVGSGDEFMARLGEFDGRFEEMRGEAEREGMVLRYVGVVDVVSGEIRAGLERYRNDHAFATTLGGSDNIVMFHTLRYGSRPLIVQGAGAGAAVTAMGVMSDLLRLV